MVEYRKKLLAVVAIVVLILLFQQQPSRLLDEGSTVIEQIEKQQDRKIQEKLVKELTDKVGAVKALELLEQSEIDSVATKHLLTHKVGEALYENYGQEALPYCENDIYFGCFHGLVLQAISDAGTESLNTMFKKCQEWPPLRARMCLHGLGHAFLAISEYDVFEALKLCDSVQTEDKIPCYDGLFMENAHGVHNGLTPPLHPYLRMDDLLYPCTSLEEKHKSMCYYNQAGWWFEVFGQDLEKTIAYCRNIPDEHQWACYNNVARIIIALSSDPEFLSEKCQLLPQEWQEKCLLDLAIHSFEYNNEQLPFVLCAKVKTGELKANCYQKLVASFREQALPQEKQKNLCRKFESGYKDICLD